MTEPTGLTLLVVDRSAERYAAALRSAFPQVGVVASDSFAAVEDRLADVEVLVTMGVPLPGLHFTGELAARMPSLRWVQCLLSGPEHVREALADRPEVLLTSIAGIHGPQMSEMAVLQMLALSRRLRQVSHNQDAARWERVPQRLLATRVVGILGIGAIGAHLAATCDALGMRVYGFSRTDRPVAGVTRMFGREQLPEVVPELDFLVCLLPADGDTHHLVDSALLSRMKPTAYLINLGRGSVVDEAALTEALSAGAIAGAGLDVFEHEPLDADSRLWQMENVIITPHLGGSHDLIAEQALTIIEPNLAAFLAGDRDGMINVVAGPGAR